MAAPKGAVKLSSSELFEAEIKSKKIVCGNLPPWSPGRLTGGYFYPTKEEIKALKAKIKVSSGKKKKTLQSKLKPLESSYKTWQNTCLGGPPSSNPYFDAIGNVTAAGKIVFGIPAALNANVNSGIASWRKTCNGCHNTWPSSLTIKKFEQMKSRIQLSPMLFQIPGEVSEQELADIVAFANF